MRIKIRKNGEFDYFFEKEVRSLSFCIERKEPDSYLGEKGEWGPNRFVFRIKPRYPSRPIKGKVRISINKGIQSSIVNLGNHGACRFILLADDVERDNCILSPGKFELDGIYDTDFTLDDGGWVLSECIEQSSYVQETPREKPEVYEEFTPVSEVKSEKHSSSGDAIFPDLPDEMSVSEKDIDKTERDGECEEMFIPGVNYESVPRIRTKNENENMDIRFMSSHEEFENMCISKVPLLVKWMLWVIAVVGFVYVIIRFLCY